MTTETTYKVSKADLDALLQKASEEILLSRYCSREVSTSTAAEVLGVTTQTVNARVRTGKLLPVNPGSSKYRFRLSDILQIEKHKTNNLK